LALETKEQKVGSSRYYFIIENELKYLRGSIVALKRDMDRLRWEIRIIDNQFSNIFKEDTYKSVNTFHNISSEDVEHRSFASSETELSDDMEILTCTSKKKHVSKDLDP
ncbi:8892_t:CDS:2, partial [Dentiscutata erythropus]